MAVSRGATVARIDSLTDRIFDEVPFQLNGTTFIYPPSPENTPRPIFCKDGFHPATMAQTLIADILVDALNRATAGTIPPLPTVKSSALFLALIPISHTSIGRPGSATCSPTPMAMDFPI